MVTTHGGLQGQIMAKGLMIIEVFIAQCEPVDALAKKVQKTVITGRFPARTIEKCSGLSR